MPSDPATPYVITAKTPNGVIQQTRMQAAGALILAGLWREAGYIDVEVSDRFGRVLTSERHRDTLLNRPRRNA